MEKDILKLQDGETRDQYILRIGNLKKSGVTTASWTEIGRIMDAELGESRNRRTYARIYSELVAKQYDGQPMPADPVREALAEMEKSRIRQRDDLNFYRSGLRMAARTDDFLDLFAAEIEKFEPPVIIHEVHKAESKKAVIALVSDLHYGMEYESYLGNFSPDIAWDNMMAYAGDIISFAQANNADTVYIGLLGDMISGNIHTTTRVQNRKNIVEQVVGASELVSAFIQRIATSVSKVVVGSVNGNHSRVDKDIAENMNGERLDYLIYWYAQTKLSAYSNVFFVQEMYSGTVGLFNVFGKKYAFIHGDLDKDDVSSRNRLKDMPGLEDIYCILAGHKHYPLIKMDAGNYIQNGCICGAGDDYSVKNRLVSEASQVMFVASEDGIGEISVVKFKDI